MGRRKSFQFPLTEYFCKKNCEESPLKIYETSLDLPSILTEIFFSSDLPLYKTPLGMIIT